MLSAERKVLSAGRKVLSAEYPVAGQAELIQTGKSFTRPSFRVYPCPSVVSSSRRGFTLVELLIVVAVLALLFGGLVRITDGLRNDAKRQQARVLLTALASATGVYAELQAPLEDGSEGADAATGYPPGAFDADARPCLAALLATPQTRQKLAGLGWPWSRLLDDSEGWVDPWGRPLRYVTRLHDERAVRMNGGKPFWVSAGPDGRFGDANLAQRSDNISSDEPM